MNTTNLSILELMDIHIVFLGINYNSANELSNGNENTDPPYTCRFLLDILDWNNWVTGDTYN